jgi:light-regulated signal transduction histidine kinase (bacteriophytochrome)
VQPFETVRQAKNGRRIDVSVTISPIKDSSGKIVGASKVARDITERKRAEQQVRALNAELEAFSYSVSHDLRAPLRHIMGFVQLLQLDAGPSLSEENLLHLTTISDSAKRMGNLIDDLLDFSRVGRGALQKADVNLDDLVRDALGDFQAETQRRSIAWEIHPLPSVRADRALLRLVLVNLMSNAVKFTGHRTMAKIEIGCAPDGNGETVILVRDNGAGFNPKYIKKLFGVFQRLHSQDEFEGTGIGLANVQRIIQRHGGRTWAEGVVDGGATFYFSIPKQMEA